MIDHDRHERLAGYLDEVSADARFWERSHCLLFLARWVAIERPSFDLKPFLGRCTGPVTAHKILVAEGGVDALVEREAAAAGLPAVDPAAATIGAIGLIRVPRARGGHRTFGCIRGLDEWVVRSREGTTHLKAATMKIRPHLAWSV